jgi:hypothetical protein
MERKRLNILLVIVFLSIFVAGGYYSYKKDQTVINNGIYTIAQVEKISLARGGWRVWLQIRSKYGNLNEDAVYFYEYFNINSIGDRYFIKILYDSSRSIKTMRLVPVIKVPDSIKSVPSEGWSEEWMRQHFPKVVEYVHDTR